MKGLIETCASFLCLPTRVWIEDKKVNKPKTRRDLQVDEVEGISTTWLSLYRWRMGRINRGNYIYISLLLVRLIVSFTSTSFIHPDEYFQSTEVTSPIIFPSFSNSSLTTWEWNPSNPCRSIVPIYLTTALPFWVLKAWTNHPSAKQLFLSTRLGSFAFSLIIGYCLFSTLFHHKSTRN